MNKTALWIGLLAAVGLAGAAVWVMDSNSTESEADQEVGLLEEHGHLPAHTAQRGERPREGKRGRRGAIARIEALEAEVAALKREVKMLRGVKGVAPAIAALQEGDAPDAPGFEGAVREIIESDRKEERELQQERRRDGMRAMIDDTVKQLAEEGGLDDEQRQSVAGLWQTEADTLLPLFMAARNGDRSFPEVRAEAKKVREETDAAAKSLLTEDQFETYEELRPRGRRRGPR